MLVRAIHFVALVLTALLLGTSFAHVLERPAKVRYPGELYATLQQTLYVQWGPPAVTSFVEPGAIVAVLALALLARRRAPLRGLAAGAVIALLLAFPGVFFWLVEPANAVFRAADPAALPPDWARWRDQWELGHTIRFALHLTAFGLLAAAALTGERRS